MNVRQIIAASVLAVTAVAAMSQEIDPGENLQGRSLAAQREKAIQALAQAREASGVEGRSAEVARQAKAGESTEALAVKASPDSQHAKGKTRSKGRFDLTRWHPKYESVGDEQG